MAGRRPNHTSLTPERRELLARLLREKGIAGAGERAIPRRPEGPVRLSFAQEAVWFLDQLEPERALHNVPGAVRLTGRLDSGALARSLGEIVRRHESLRTVLTLRDGLPYQVPRPAGPFSLPITDLGGLGRAEAEAEVQRLATEEAHRVFDMAEGPLFRAFLLRLTAQEHVLVLNFHHIVTDGWSMGVFTRELDQLYRAYREGRPSPLSEPTLQIGDFAAWQRAELAGKALEEHLDYWRQELAGEIAGVTLPTDRPRPAVQSFRGGHVTMQLSRKKSDELRALSQRRGVTLFMTLLAGFDVLMYDYSRETDVVIGSALAHRNRSELEGVIGFLVNMLILRTDLSGNPTFAEILERAKKVTLGAWSHQDLPLTRIVNEVQPERDLSKNPLFQVQFSLLTPDHNPAVYGYGLAAGMIETLELPELVMTPVSVQYDNSRYDVAAFLWDMPGGIHGTIEYSRDLYEEETIARMVRRYETLLDLVLERPEDTLEELVAGLARRDREVEAAAGRNFEESMKNKLKSIRRRRSS